MDKITEELFTSLIKRVDKIEERVNYIYSNLNKNKSENKRISKNKPGMATQGQIDFIIGLGGDPLEDMTSKEASDYIDKLKENKKYPKSTKSDTNHSSDNSYLNNKTLTKEEIEDLEKEGALF